MIIKTPILLCLTCKCIESRVCMWGDAKKKKSKEEVTSSVSSLLNCLFHPCMHMSCDEKMWRHRSAGATNSAQQRPPATPLKLC